MNLNASVIGKNINKDKKRNNTMMLNAEINNEGMLDVIIPKSLWGKKVVISISEKTGTKSDEDNFSVIFKEPERRKKDGLAESGIIDALYGKYRNRLSGSEMFARRKQEDIKAEEEKWKRI